MINPRVVYFCRGQKDFLGGMYSRPFIIWFIQLEELTTQLRRLQMYTCNSAEIWGIRNNIWVPGTTPGNPRKLMCSPNRLNVGEVKLISWRECKTSFHSLCYPNVGRHQENGGEQICFCALLLLGGMGYIPNTSATLIQQDHHRKYTTNRKR